MTCVTGYPREIVMIISTVNVWQVSSNVESFSSPSRVAAPAYTVKSLLMIYNALPLTPVCRALAHINN